MEEKTKDKQAETPVTETKDVQAETTAAPASENTDKKPGKQGNQQRMGDRRDRQPGRPRRGGGRGRRGGRFERQKPEFDQKIISIRRVTRVVAGGRRFAFSVSLVAGNRNGKVGVGIGKATDTALAIEKAFKSAKKNMITIPRTKTKSIAHDVRSRYCSSDIFMQPAPGKGIVAGSSVRVVLDLAGVTDVSGKIFSRSKNQLNNARATLNALSELPQTPADPASKDTAKGKKETKKGAPKSGKKTVK